jgi:hypothetical protein
MRQRRATLLPLATLDGAEGITAEGSYTWGNEVALRLRPRKIDSFFSPSVKSIKYKTY